MAERFRAVLISRDEDKKQSVEMTELGLDDLMEGDVVVAVEVRSVQGVFDHGHVYTGDRPGEVRQTREEEDWCGETVLRV